MEKPKGKIYIGNPPHQVLAQEPGGELRPLDPRLDLRNHSPTGFAWGYLGSGPSQLALAILADVTGDDELALEWYQDFKRDRLASWPGDRPWSLTQQDILAWVGARAEAELDPAEVV